jgi:cytidylate kinase
MPVITIRGQLGSGAPEIGRLIAEKLQIDYVDREIIAKVAEKLNRHKDDISEKEMPPTSLTSRISAALGHVPPATIGSGGILMPYLPTWEIPLDDQRYFEGLKSIISELASTGSIVIRGRGSQFILKDTPASFHILTVAPLALRVKRIMDTNKRTEDIARKEIERFDSSRREFIKRYFKAELEDPVNYDLVINTEHLDIDAAAMVVIYGLSKQQNVTEVCCSA